MANKKITDLMSGTPVRDSLLESAIDISGTMDSRKVKAGAVADLANANVAAPYDTTVTYAIGQYCLYEGDIYRCIAITTGAFDSTAWTQIVVTGEFRRVVELTSAQYSALTSAEKNNGTLYILTDEETTAADIPYSQGVSVANKLDSLSNYSTTERVVGKWTDGSTLYEQTIEVNNPTYTTVTDYDYFNLAELNVNADIGFFVSGYAIRSDDRRLSLPYNRFYSAGNILIPEVYIDYATGKIFVSITKLSSWNVTINKVTITVRYTKKS